MAPKVCDFDEDGISLYFFSSNFKKYENVKDSQQVERLFYENHPSGGTNLTKVLLDAVEPDNLGASGKRKPETILIITDGVPDNRTSVEKVIIDASNKLDVDNDLSITVIQVGNDSSGLYKKLLVY